MVRAIPFLLAPALLAGCVEAPGPAARPSLSPAGFPSTVPAQRKIAVLLPLTGQNAALGRDLLRAVQLALGSDGPQPDVQDTGSTPTGATAATLAAVAHGDVVIVGPLTAPETAAAAAVAGSVPILAFTSDQNQGRPGVWALGITPQQQVARLVEALSQAGKANVAAVLPDNAFGNALADGLTRATASVGDPPPAIKRYPTGRAAALDTALRDVADFTNRSALANPPADTTPNPANGTPAAPTASPVPSAPLAPAPFDALLLAESGAMLQTAAAGITKYQIAPPAVQIVGPGTWARDAANLGGLACAWYAAPDPATRGAFEQIYTATYGGPPPSFASIAYDAAELARVAAATPGALTQPGGFRGADGPVALRPDGQVVRGLAVFAVGRDGARVVQPVPATLGSGS
jgi:branched-chain amino acid transport system substrate-binding protein